MDLEKTETTPTPIEEKNLEEEFYDKILKEYDENHRERLALLNELPPPVFHTSNNDFDVIFKKIKQFEVYLKLSKDANQEDSYFVSAYKASLANKKEYLFPEEIIEKMMKIYNIDEYGSNLSADTYDPKSLIQDTNSFYENLAKKQLEIYSGGSLNINTKSNNSNPNLTMNASKKTFWDAGPGAYNEPNKNQPQNIGNQLYPNMYTIPNSLIIGQNNYEQLNSLAMNPLAMIAKQNKAFVEKNK